MCKSSFACWPLLGLGQLWKQAECWFANTPSTSPNHWWPSFIHGNRWTAGEGNEVASLAYFLHNTPKSKKFAFLQNKAFVKSCFFCNFCIFYLTDFGGGGNYTGKLLYSQTNGSCKLHGFGQFYTKSRCKMKYQCVQTGQSNHVTLQVCTTPSFGVHFCAFFDFFGIFSKNCTRHCFFLMLLCVLLEKSLNNCLIVPNMHCVAHQMQ